MNQKTFLEQLARFQSFLALALMVVALSLASPNFLTVDNTRAAADFHQPLPVARHDAGHSLRRH
jgi:ribose/xylose/arabinose/galactoside ABC-type transport system permease subunit